MIKDAIENWEKNKPAILAEFKSNHPEAYIDVVRTVIRNITDDQDWGAFCPDPERIHQIDDGDYQGTLVFVIGAQGYQPSNYWYVKVNYGSCSGCDTLQAIREYSDEKPTDDQANQYLTLALHIVQGLKKMGDDE